MKIISRDPFARASLGAVRVYVVYGRTCDWSGQVHVLRGRIGFEYRYFLYKYYVVHDDGRVDPVKGLFYSVSDMKAYHNWGDDIF